jgi:hypothetical protein
MPYLDIVGNTKIKDTYSQIEDAFNDVEADLAVKVGTWDNALAYTTGQAIYYSGKFYKALQNGTNKTPSSEALYWEEIGGSTYTHPETHPATIITVADTGEHFTSTDVEGVLDELFTSVSSGKGEIAAAITGKGVSASGSDTFNQLSTKISSIPVGVNGFGSYFTATILSELISDEVGDVAENISGMAIGDKISSTTISVVVT